MSNELSIDDLRISSQIFNAAYEHADELTTDELFSALERIQYQSFGYPAIQLYKFSDKDWHINLRNDVNWQEHKPECTGKTVKEALIKMYAWCVYKNYLQFEITHNY